MADLFADGFESGDLSAWSSAATDEGKLSVTEAAALHGTYGMAIFIDDTTLKYVQDDTPDSETRYRCRFYIDPNTITIPDTTGFDVQMGVQSGTGVSRVWLLYSEGIGYQIHAGIRDDANTWFNTSDYPITDAPHCIEVDWKAATGAGQNNGYISLWIDGVFKETYNSVDNDTKAITSVWLEARYMTEGTSGTFYLDDFASNNDGNEIGVISDTADFVYAGIATGAEFTYSGSATTEVGFSYAGTGSFTYSGTATIIYSKNYLTVGSGSLAFSGSAVIIIGLTYVGQTGKWSGLGMGTYWDYESDYDTLLANGFTELRIDIPNYEETTWLAYSKTAVISAVGKGARVIWGVSTGVTLTSSNWSAYATAVESAATWAQANGVFEFQIGNELEQRVDGTTLTVTQLRTNLKALATSVQAIFINGNVSYPTSEDYINGWVSAGKGNIDFLSLNVYIYDDVGWKWQIDTMFGAFGANGTYITEFNIDGDNVNHYSEDEAVQAAGVTEMIDYIRAAGMTRAIFFTWHDLGSFTLGVVKTDDTYRLLWWSLLDSGGSSFKFSGSATQSYGYNFNTVAEGSFGYSGAGSYIVGFSSVASGSFDFSGAGVCVLGFAYIGSGSLTYSGTATAYIDTRHYIISASGSVGFSGAASCILGFSCTASGSFGYSGAAITTIGLAYSGSGSLDFSGTATQLHSKYYLYTGAGTSFAYSGTASQIHGYNFNTSGAGSFNFSGEAVCYKELGYVGTGSFAFSGTATQSYTFNYSCVASGSFAFSGVGTYLLGFSYVTSGSLVFSGVGTYELGISYVGSGSFNYSGVAVYSYDTEIPPEDFIYTGTGGILFSGSAVVEAFNFISIGSGSFAYSGIAVQTYTYNYLYSASGILTYSGIARVVTRYNWTKVNKVKDDWTKVSKSKGDWIKVEKE